MVRCANRSKTPLSVSKGMIPCATHYFPSGSRHAPYKFVRNTIWLVGQTAKTAVPGIGSPNRLELESLLL